MKGNASSFSAERDELVSLPDLTLTHNALSRLLIHVVLSVILSRCSHRSSLCYPHQRVRKVEAFVGSGMVSAALKVACVGERIIKRNSMRTKLEMLSSFDLEEERETRERESENQHEKEGRERAT